MATDGSQKEDASVINDGRYYSEQVVDKWSLIGALQRQRRDEGGEDEEGGPYTNDA